MKKHIYTLFSVLIALVAVSCEKTSEGVTQVVSFFQMYGASSIYLGVGDEFVDPGYQELDGGGQVVTVITNMYGDEVEAVSTEEPGFFTITYSTINEQGLYFEKSRKVYIYDATVTETLGVFTVDGQASLSYNNEKTYSDNAASFAASGRTTNDSPTITFTQVVGNIYSVSDLLGGWYTWIQGRGPLYEETYGISFFDMTGYVTLNADMTLSLMSSKIAAWGDGLDFIENAVYDPDTKRLVYDWSYASQVFGHVEMVQN